MTPSYSFIIPVYNRPDEIRELLESLAKQTYSSAFEVVVVEDGSEDDAKEVVDTFQGNLTISYIFKDNSGPGDSRNEGMRKARGDYFIILDSDCVLPPNYLEIVDRSLDLEFVHCFGGPDSDTDEFTTVQRAINYSMTSPLTTGGLRGGKRSLTRFQPRSFNMGLSKEAFQRSGGFGKIHPGEDPDLVIRLWKLGYATRLFPDAVVFHKRRIDFKSFLRQVYRFGVVRAILNSWHPETQSLMYWLPTIFIAGILDMVFYGIIGWPMVTFALSMVYITYLLLIFFHSLFTTGNFLAALLSPFTTILQFIGYGWGFIKSTFLVNFIRKKPQSVFPGFFFKD